MQQFKKIIILGNILSVLTGILAELYLLICLIVPLVFSDGPIPEPPVWYIPLISLIMITVAVFVLFSIDHSKKQNSRAWAYAPFLIFAIFGCGILIMGAYRLQQANQIENQDRIYLQQLRNNHSLPSRSQINISQ